MSIRALVTIGLLALASDALAQAPEEIRLWPGKGPGSEQWTRPEVTTTSPTGDRTISNVSDPALAERSDASPDFLVSVYGPSLQEVNVPAHAPPLFIAVGASPFNVTNGCLALFAAWKAAGKPAEIHVYDRVSAGFGMTPRGLPVDSWSDRLLDWLAARKLT